MCPGFIDKVKSGAGERLMGFGHRVYKSYDPRAKLIKKVAYDVFEQTGLNPKLEIALELERIALSDEYFIKRKLYPNVDFYSGLIYQAMGYPTDYFTVLFALGPAAGMGGAVGRDAARQGAEDRPATTDLRGRRGTELRAAGGAAADRAWGWAQAASRAVEVTGVLGDANRQSPALDLGPPDFTADPVMRTPDVRTGSAIGLHG